MERCGEFHDECLMHFWLTIHGVTVPSSHLRLALFPARSFELIVGFSTFSVWDLSFAITVPMARL